MGKIVIKETKNGGYGFNLLATNGQVIATSQVYKDLPTCQAGAASVIENAPAARLEDQTDIGFEELACPKFEVYADKAGEFRFRLKAKNGLIVAVSEGYKELKTCLNGVESVKKNAADAEVVQE